MKILEHVWFLLRSISKMNDIISEGQISFLKFHSVNVKGNLTHLAGKNAQPGAKISTMFRLRESLYRQITLIVL